MASKVPDTLQTGISNNGEWIAFYQGSGSRRPSI